VLAGSPAARATWRTVSLAQVLSMVSSCPKSCSVAMRSGSGELSVTCPPRRHVQVHYARGSGRRCHDFRIGGLRGYYGYKFGSPLSEDMSGNGRKRPEGDQSSSALGPVPPRLVAGAHQASPGFSTEYGAVQGEAAAQAANPEPAATSRGGLAALKTPEMPATWPTVVQAAGGGRAVAEAGL
jgi:hypothetical protein